MLEGHTLGRFGEVIEELGRSLVFRVNKEKPAKHKGKKMNKKGVDASFFFFFWPCCFQVRNKSCNASYEHILSKYD